MSTLLNVNLNELKTKKQKQFYNNKHKCMWKNYLIPEVIQSLITIMYLFENKTLFLFQEHSTTLY